MTCTIVRSALALAWLVLIPGLASAQDSPFVNGLTEMLQDSRLMIRSWENQALILVGLAVTVGTLGVITGILQGAQHSWTKVATVAVGAIISVSTVVSTTVFPADHRTFKQSAASGRAEVKKMEVLLLDLRSNLSSENQRAYRDEFLSHYDTITKIEMNLLGAPRTKPTSWLDPLPNLSVAVAQERTPSWVQDKPRDTPTSRFFVGTAEAAELDTARQASLRNAEDQAVREIVKEVAKGTTSVDALDELRLRDLVKKLGDVTETGFLSDKQRLRFKYWTLLRLNPKAFDARVVSGGTPVKSSPGARILHSVDSQYFNGDRTLRVEYANVLIEPTGRATLSFQAAATIRVRFPARSSPAVSLLFLDKNRKSLGLFRDVAHASVEACGGYENHETVLRDADFPRPILDRASAFMLQVQLGDVPVVRCDRAGGVPPPF